VLRRRWRELRQAPTDAGVSLVELLVSMGLMTLVGGLALTYFVSSGTTTSRTTDTSFAAAQARTAMSAVTTLLRLADSPTSQAGYSASRFENGFTAAQATFYSNVNNNRATQTTVRGAPAKVVLTATGAQLIEKLYNPLSSTVPADYTTNYSATPTSTRVLANDLANTSVFSYCAVLDTAASTCLTPATTGDTVAAVTVVLTISGKRGTTQILGSTIGITGALS
jgi:Tfp pilus assembly protein FimT